MATLAERECTGTQWVEARGAAQPPHTQDALRRGSAAPILALLVAQMEIPAHVPLKVFLHEHPVHSGRAAQGGDGVSGERLDGRETQVSDTANGRPHPELLSTAPDSVSIS